MLVFRKLNSSELSCLTTGSEKGRITPDGDYFSLMSSHGPMLSSTFHYKANSFPSVSFYLIPFSPPQKKTLNLGNI